MMTAAIALLLRGTLGSLVMSGAAMERDGAPPAVQWVGPQSGIAEAGFFCIEDREAWSALWERHAAECADRAHQGWVMPPEVDFDRFMVVGAFAGERDVTNGAVVQGVQLRADALVIRYDWIEFQTASGLGGEEPEPDYVGTPFGLWVVERFAGPVVLEEDKRGLINAAPEWREVHRFGGEGVR
jgi:hypothetical protein